VQKLSLAATAREQLKRAAAASAGRAASTVVGGHEHQLRQTVIAMTGGAVLAEHDNPGEATVQVLSGRVQLVAGDSKWDARSGDLLIIPPSRHELIAVEDAAVLLTVVVRT
jgi:quercetin dioxygenase-like cupin family protein